MYSEPAAPEALSITGAKAQEMTARDFFAIPLCWPDSRGLCACPKRHTNEKEIGKAPLLGNGYQETRWTANDVQRFFARYPQANYGILLKPSGLFVLDADSAEADREIEALGISPGPRVARGDHVHRYFHNRAGVLGRAIQVGTSGKIDILTDGYVVGPGSLHRSGSRYEEEIPFGAIELDDPPKWALDLLRAGVNGHSATEAIPEHLPPVDIDALSIPRWTKMLIRGGPAVDPTKYSSRSEALFAVLHALMQSNITDTATLASILLNPQYAISEKPREQGRRWLAAEIARARAKCTQGNRSADGAQEQSARTKEGDVSNGNGTVTEPPRPLRRVLPAPDPYPIERLGVLAPAAQRLAETIQAPRALCGQSLLAAAALAVQPYRDIVIDGRVIPLSENFISIGESGERKSAVDREALRPHRGYEQALAAHHATKLIEYDNELAAYKKAREEVLKKAKTRTAKKQALDDLGSSPTTPLLPICITEEPTYEGLVKLLLVGQPSLGLFADEGGRMIGGYGMSEEQQLKTAAGLSELWDGKRISRVRSGDGAALLYGRRVSMHLMAQPEVAQRLLNNSLMRDQGLLSRVLATWPTSTAGSRLYKEVDLRTV